MNGEEDIVPEETETERTEIEVSGKPVHLRIEPLGDANIETRKLWIAIEEPLVSATVPRLMKPLLNAVLSANWPVVLDLRAVSEIDSDGLTLLLKLHKTMPVEVRPLSLRVTPDTQVARVLNLSGFGMIMTLLIDAD